MYTIGMPFLHHLRTNKEKMMSIFISILPRRQNDNGISVFVYSLENSLYSKANAVKSYYNITHFLFIIAIKNHGNV